MPVTKPKARTDLTVVELDGEAVIYDEDSGDLHHLNPTATIVFGLCDGTSTMREMSEDLSAAFGVPRDEIERQVRALVRQLRKVGLLAPTSPNGHGGISA
ncbi:MAG: HPr-rel-A system PqqD family peptide chaperone [Candidatus Velamenicoccus archaeovorus]